MKTPAAMLIDTTRCTGCEECVMACKKKNGLGIDRAWSGRTKPNDLSSSRFTTIVRRPGNHYVRRLCRHCLEPACASACIVGALHKTPEGPVVYDESKCMGCRYCMVACPFDVPRYEWEAAAPLVRKCTFCHDQLGEGKLPACVEHCPGEVSLIGSREEMLAEAHRRLKEKPDTYVQKVFGEHEAGGTSVMYVSDIPLGFLSWRPGLGAQPLPQLTWAALKKVPPTILFMGGLMAGIYWFIGRRMKLAAEAADATTPPVAVGDDTHSTESSDATSETTAKESEEKKND